MAALASKRRTEAAARVERLSQARNAARAAISATAAAAGTGADGGGGGRGISDAEWRAKYESVKAQLAPYKTAKKVRSERQIVLWLCAQLTAGSMCHMIERLGGQLRPAVLIKAHPTLRRSLRRSRRRRLCWHARWPCLVCRTR